MTSSVARCGHASTRGTVPSEKQRALHVFISLEHMQHVIPFLFLFLASTGDRGLATFTVFELCLRWFIVEINNKAISKRSVTKMTNSSRDPTSMFFLLKAVENASVHKRFQRVCFNALPLLIQHGHFVLQGL